MKKLLVVLFAASSILSATSMAYESTETNTDSTVSMEQIEQMKETVLAPVKWENNDLEMWGCPKGYILGIKRCWKNWKLVRCGYYCSKILPPPCCHGEGKPE